MSKAARSARCALSGTLISGSEVHRLIDDPATGKAAPRDRSAAPYSTPVPHSFFLLNWMFGGIDTIRATTAKLVEVAQVEDQCAGERPPEVGSAVLERIHLHRRDPLGRTPGDIRQRGLDHHRPPARTRPSSTTTAAATCPAIGARPNPIPNTGRRAPSPKAWPASWRPSVGVSRHPYRRKSAPKAIRAVLAAYESVAKGGLEVKVR